MKKWSIPVTKPTSNQTNVSGRAYKRTPMKVKWKGKTDFLMLTHDKVYEVLSIEKGWYRVVDDSKEDYLYPPEQFEIVEE